MLFQRIISSCLVFPLLVTIACSSESNENIEPIEVRPEVQITTPLDSNGILNSVEANAVVVNGTSTIEDGFLVTVLISDGQNTVGSTAVVQEGTWTTDSMAISNFRNGEIKVTAEGMSAKGSMSNLAETTLYLDQESPTIHITGPITGDDAIDSSEATAVVVKGTSDAANDQIVLITFGDENADHLTAETKVTNGQWETEVDISALKSGSLILMAEVSDIAGNPRTVQRSGVILE